MQSGRGKLHLLPKPNARTLSSTTFPCSSRNRSGLKEYGSGWTLSSCVIAQMLVITVTPIKSDLFFVLSRRDD